MSAWPRRTFISVALASLLLATAAGCGGGGGNVSGQVKVKDKPVLEGLIIFRQVGGKKAASAAIKDGKYAATKVPTGDVVVLIAGTLDPPEPPQKEKGKKPGKDKKDKKDKDKKDKTGAVPPKYNDPATALTYTVKSGDQEKDFILEP
jgi:hypothetical protein